jgi:hypothetical protein
MSPDELLAEDLEALFEKHGINSGVVAMTNDTHFTIISCNMSNNGLRVLGQTLLACTPNEHTVLN